MSILFPSTLRWFCTTNSPSSSLRSSLFLSSFLASSSSSSASRTFTSSSTSKHNLIFDRKVKSLQRSRVLRHGSSQLSQFEYIHREVVLELLDRLRDITFSGSKPEEEEGEGRRSFDRVLDLGSRLPSRDPNADKEEGKFSSLFPFCFLLLPFVYFVPSLLLLLIPVPTPLPLPSTIHPKSFLFLQTIWPNN
jgi:hypothetical protein